MLRGTSIRSNHTMARLIDLAKKPTFTKLNPDKAIPTVYEALCNNDNIIHTPRILKQGAYSWTLPEKRVKYQYFTSSEKALEDLGLSPDQVHDETFQKIVSGEFYNDNEKLTDTNYPLPFPYSQAYAGWQFGQFAGQLGDGRVVNLFEIDKKDLKNTRDRPVYELQLKGSGKTPFSRFADGKAIIGSSIREFLISEHLNALKIPTTRALSLTYLPKTFAQRNEGAKKCAVVARFAESWIRLGNFDLYRWRGDREGIKQLSDYVIEELFKFNDQEFLHLEQLLKAKSDFFNDSINSIGSLTKYDKLYYEIVIRNATTTAMWQVYGFLNGVLNTDNTSVLGLSLDFGPFAILDRFNPDFSPNTSDYESRYAYKNVPTVIWWNLTRLGENLAELIGAGEDILNDKTFQKGELKKDWENKIISRATKIIEIGGEIYKYAFTKKYVEMFFARLGISSTKVDTLNPNVQNEQVIMPLLNILRKVHCDFNNFFLILQKNELNGKSIADDVYTKDVIENANWSKDEFIENMDKWIDSVKTYFDETERKTIASQNNPLFLPRTWILQEVIDDVEESKGENLEKLEKLKKMCLNPFDQSKWGNELKETESRWMVQNEECSMIKCTGCS